MFSSSEEFATAGAAVAVPAAELAAAPFPLLSLACWADDCPPAGCSAPVLGKTFWKFWPPSVERYTPRSLFGPYGCPATAAKTLLESRGSTASCGICWPSRRPRCVQVLPASVDL